MRRQEPHIPTCVCQECERTGSGDFAVRAYFASDRLPQVGRGLVHGHTVKHLFARSAYRVSVACLAALSSDEERSGRK